MKTILDIASNFISILIIVGLIFIGCNGIMIAQKPSQVCPPPEGQKSWLCERSEQLGITLEQIYGWVYAPVAAGVVFDKLDRENICEFDDKISDWYIRNYPFSYDRLILEFFNQLKLIDDPAKLGLLTNIINRNLILYKSESLISAYDDSIIRKGNNQFRLDMYCE